MAQPAKRQASGASQIDTRYAVMAVPATRAATIAAVPPSIANASAPIASATIAAYSRLGTRAAAAESPYTSMAAPDIQYERGGFSRNGVSASCGSVRSVCRLMRQAISASRGSSGVHAPRHRIPITQMGASARTTRRGQRRTVTLCPRWGSQTQEPRIMPGSRPLVLGRRSCRTVASRPWSGSASAHAALASVRSTVNP